MNVTVIGANSYIGRELMRRLCVAGHRVSGTTRRDTDSDLIFLDLAKPLGASIKLLAFTEPDVTFFCAALSSFRACEMSPWAARIVNLISVIDITSAVGGKFVLLSSAAAETHPGTVYGALKLECENRLQKTMGERAAAYRFGPVIYPGRDCYANGEYQPLSITDVCDELVDACDHWRPGLHRITAGRGRDAHGDQGAAVPSARPSAA